MSDKNCEKVVVDGREQANPGFSRRLRNFRKTMGGVTVTVTSMFRITRYTNV